MTLTAIASEAAATRSSRLLNSVIPIGKLLPLNCEKFVLDGVICDGVWRGVAVWQCGSVAGCGGRCPSNWGVSEKLAQAHQHRRGSRHCGTVGIVAAIRGSVAVNYKLHAQ